MVVAVNARTWLSLRRGARGSETLCLSLVQIQYRVMRDALYR
jgi:hypothetical protein